MQGATYYACGGMIAERIRCELNKWLIVAAAAAAAAVVIPVVVVVVVVVDVATAAEWFIKMWP